ncbi:unnamed protein product, partial [Symbiodinium sp. KB8]
MEDLPASLEEALEGDAEILEAQSGGRRAAVASGAADGAAIGSGPATRGSDRLRSFRESTPPVPLPAQCQEGACPCCPVRGICWRRLVHISGCPAVGSARKVSVRLATQLCGGLPPGSTRAPRTEQKRSGAIGGASSATSALWESRCWRRRFRRARVSGEAVLAAAVKATLLRAGDEELTPASEALQGRLLAMAAQ